MVYVLIRFQHSNVLEHYDCTRIVLNQKHFNLQKLDKQIVKLWKNSRQTWPRFKAGYCCSKHNVKGTHRFESRSKFYEGSKVNQNSFWWISRYNQFCIKNFSYQICNLGNLYKKDSISLIRKIYHFGDNLVNLVETFMFLPKYAPFSSPYSW